MTELSAKDVNEEVIISKHDPKDQQWKNCLCSLFLELTRSQLSFPNNFNHKYTGIRRIDGLCNQYLFCR